ncbi:MAG: ROK family protein [Dehalococcoidia bacterium]|nr:ROK family protein [Dehalococcoidia bacterium]
MAGTQLVAGIDLGGTKILSVCVSRDLTIAGRDLRPTDAGLGPDAVIARMADSARAAYGGNTIAAAGISAPGPADLTRGILTTPPNLPGWHNVPLARSIGGHLGVPTWLENDANAAALAEHRLGAGRGSDHMILVTIGTGLGGGLILDGHLYHGASGAGGEIGHMQLEPEGRLCGCGRRGCLEALASGSALDAAATDLAEAYPDGLIARLAQREGVTPDARILHLAAESGNAGADAAIHKAGRYLGAGLTNLVDVFNPQVIVIGGSLRKLGSRYLDTARAVVKAEAFPQSYADVRILEAELGDEAPAIGAALLALDNISEGA